MIRTQEQKHLVRAAIEDIALNPSSIGVDHARVLRDEILRLRSDLAELVRADNRDHRHCTVEKCPYCRAEAVLAEQTRETTAHPVDSSHGDQQKIAGLLVRDLRDLSESIVQGTHTVSDAVRDLRMIVQAYREDR